MFPPGTPFSKILESYRLALMTQAPYTLPNDDVLEQLRLLNGEIAQRSASRNTYPKDNAS